MGKYESLAASLQAREADEWSASFGEIEEVLGFPLPLIDRLCKVLPHASARRIREHRDDLILILGDSPVLEVLPGCGEIPQKENRCARGNCATRPVLNSTGLKEIV